MSDIEPEGLSGDPVLQEVVRRLRPIVADWEWSVEAGVTLVEILHLCEIAFSDGFVINGDEHVTTLGRAGACWVVASVARDAEKHDWKWWSRRAHTRRDIVYPEGFFDQLVKRLAGHPSVLRVCDVEVVDS